MRFASSYNGNGVIASRWAQQVWSASWGWWIVRANALKESLDGVGFWFLVHFPYWTVASYSSLLVYRLYAVVCNRFCMIFILIHIYRMAPHNATALTAIRIERSPVLRRKLETTHRKYARTTNVKPLYNLLEAGKSFKQYDTCLGITYF